VLCRDTTGSYSGLQSVNAYEIAYSTSPSSSRGSFSEAAFNRTQQQQSTSNRSIQPTVNKLSQLLQGGDSSDKRLLLAQEWLNKKTTSKGLRQELKEGAVVVTAPRTGVAHQE
jgi:hypothetical protein